MPQLQGINTAGSGVTQVASVEPHSDSMQRVAMASMPAATTAQANAQDGNIIRDASLDQYLEAHQQFGLQPVVSGSMPLLRAASLTTQGQ
jgi:sigma-E factor negative regulatory protein RseA